jgi:dTDP-4-amino-4,6-dideoxygalactose transaminase
MIKNIAPVVPMSSPDISEEDREAVHSVINTPYLSMGPWVDRFEDAFRTVTGRKHAIAVNSGTSGLHLAIRAIGVQRGGIVITTPFSFVASTNAILFENALPVFVDVDPVTGNMDMEQLTRAVDDLTAGGERARKWLPRKLPRYFDDAGTEIQPALKALLPVDVFGQPADMDAVTAIARKHNLPVIEDSCEALGAIYKKTPAGKTGDIGIFAFYPNKQITTGEGGMIVTDNDAYAATMLALRNQGRAPGDNWLQHTLLGYNYRMDEMSAAMGASQMKRLDNLLTARQAVAEMYARHLASIPEIEPLAVVPTTTRMSWFVYVVRTPRGVDRKAVADRLAAKGIPVRPYFLPIHLQPYMAERFGYRPGDYPVTEDLGERGLALPFSGVMKEDQVELVCQALRESV